MASSPREVQSSAVPSAETGFNVLVTNDESRLGLTS